MLLLIWITSCSSKYEATQFERDTDGLILVYLFRLIKTPLQLWIHPLLYPELKIKHPPPPLEPRTRRKAKKNLCKISIWKLPLSKPFKFLKESRELHFIFHLMVEALSSSDFNSFQNLISSLFEFNCEKFTLEFQLPSNHSLDDLSSICSPSGSRDSEI